MNASLNDEELIRRYHQSQPTDCFEELYSRYVRKVYHRCLSFTRDADQAQDFTHDIFIKMFAKLDKFQERSSFSTWLYSISHNYCVDQLRVAKRLPTDSMNEALSDQPTDTDELASLEERHQGLEQVMASLSAQELALLRLKYQDDLSIEAIAQQSGLGASAVKMRLKRSRDKIYHLYQQQHTA